MQNLYPAKNLLSFGMNKCAIIFEKLNIEIKEENAQARCLKNQDLKSPAGFQIYIQIAVLQTYIC